MAGLTRQAELEHIIETLEEHATELKRLPPEIIAEVKHRCMVGLGRGRFGTGSELAQFVVDTLKEMKDRIPDMSDPNNPFSAAAQAMAEERRQELMKLMQQKMINMPTPIIEPRQWNVNWSDPAPKLTPVPSPEDEVMADWHKGASEAEKDDTHYYDFGGGDIALKPFMASVVVKAQTTSSHICPGGKRYDYMRNFCNGRSKTLKIDINEESAQFVADFLANFLYILDDSSASFDRHRAIGAAFDTFLEDETMGDILPPQDYLFGDDLTTEEFSDMILERCNDEIKSILRTHKNRIATTQVVTTQPRNTNMPTTLPKIDPNELAKIDAIVSIMQGNSNVKVAEIYNTAQAYEQEIADLKAKANAVKEPVGIKALTADMGIIHMPWHDRLVTDIKLARTIAVRGPAGNGKSTGVKAALESLEYNIYHLDCTDSTTVDQLVGGLEPVPTVKGGIEMKFKDGIFTKAFKDEKGAIQLDEFDALDPRVTMALQSALHRAANGKKRVVSCPDHPDGKVVAVGDCPIVVTMNTWGTGATREYVGRNAIDAASLDRFDTIISTDYQCEAEMLDKMGMKKSDANALLAEIKDYRRKINEKGLRVILSTRRVLNIAEVVLRLDCNVPTAISREFVERLDEYDRSALNLGVIKHG